MRVGICGRDEQYLGTGQCVNHWQGVVVGFAAPSLESQLVVHDCSRSDDVSGLLNLGVVDIRGLIERKVLFHIDFIGYVFSFDIHRVCCCRLVRVGLRHRLVLNGRADRELVFLTAVYRRNFPGEGVEGIFANYQLFQCGAESFRISNHVLRIPALTHDGKLTCRSLGDSKAGWFCLCAL